MNPFPTAAQTAAFVAAALIAAASPRAALAAPKVVADIAPIHGLAAAVTKDVDGAPAPVLLVGGGASPHSYSMKPSEAEALSKAEIVIWAGPALAPWLGRAIETLAPGAKSLDLSLSDGLRLLPARDDPRFSHDDGHDHDHGHGHKHGQHDDASGAEAFDPHFWLDPENAKAILDAVAAALATQDPANAAAYRRNAAEAKTAIDDAARDVEAALAPIKGRRFAVMHDAFHYFEDRFGIEAEGALSLSDAISPGPRQMEEIRDIIRENEVVCVFGEPQSPKRLAAAVVDGTDAKIAVLDPIGADLPSNPDHYPRLLRRLASTMAACLAR